MNLSFSLLNSVFVLFLAKNIAPQSLETGDLLFLDLDCGPLCESIEQVTIQQLDGRGPRLSHVGAVVRSNNQVQVLESWPPQGVQLTPLKDFLSRSPKVTSLRFAPHYREQAVRATQRMLTWLNRPYDDLFFSSTDRFYCSELIYEGWKEEKIEGMPVFQLRPMYFGAKTSEEWKVWSEYFAAWHIGPPAGHLGISPLGVWLDARRFTD